MSDPVSNAEIEDVLSSIRKLVSEKAGTQQGGETEREGNGKFVLTPALRVMTPVADEAGSSDAMAEPTGAAVDAAESPETQAPEAMAEGDADQAEVGVEDGRDTVEAENGSADPEPIPEPEVSEEPDQTEMPAPDTLTLHLHDRSSLETRIAELEAAVSSSQEDWEPDGSEEIDAETPDTIIYAPMGAMDDADQTALMQKAGLADAFTVDVTARPEDKVQGELVEAVILELGPRQKGADPTDAAGDPEKLEILEADHGSDSSEIDAVDVDPELDTSAVLGDEEIAFLDEDGLKDLVARLVREELQGTLGERITRNVRRLVRREIQRAMALKNLDDED